MVAPTIPLADTWMHGEWGWGWMSLMMLMMVLFSNFTFFLSDQDNGDGMDDLGLALWGLSKQLKSMFNAAGKDMTRQSFVSTLESGKSFAGGVYPPVKYSARQHFGGSQVHAVQADCASDKFKTIATFVSGF